MLVVEEIRRHNRGLLGEIEELRRVADQIGQVRLDRSMSETCRLVEMILEQIIPNARREDQFLYPVVGRLLGSLESIRAMTRDHFEIGHLTSELAKATEEEDPVAIRRLLYGLYHVLRLHVAKETEVYLPVLEGRLTPAEDEELARTLAAPKGGDDDGEMGTIRTAVPEMRVELGDRRGGPRLWLGRVPLPARGTRRPL